MDFSGIIPVLVVALLGLAGSTTNAWSCPSGYTVDNFYCYKLFTNPLNWNEAEGACVWQGGHLVSVADQAEHDFVKTLHSGDFWIGLNDWVTADDFQWVNGHNLTTFTSWAASNPGNAAYKCVVMKSAQSFDWAEEDCASELPYICMIPQNYNGPFLTYQSASANEESGCTPISCTGNVTSTFDCLTGGLAAGANVINHLASDCCSVSCQELLNVQVTSANPGADIYTVAFVTSASVPNAVALFNKTTESSENQRSGCPAIDCSDVGDENDCATLAVANHANVFNWQSPTCCLRRCDSLPALSLEADSPGSDVYAINSTAFGEFNMVSVVTAPTFPPTITTTTPPPTTTTPTTTPMVTTTRKPVEIVPWYTQPNLVILVVVGVAALIIGALCFGLKACLSAMCPKTASRCDYYCEHEFCVCPRVGPCLTFCHHCCCEDKKAKRRRLRREGRKQQKEGEWWAYYPGVGWGPAPKDMQMDGSAAGPPPAEWDPGYDYGGQDQYGDAQQENWDPACDYSNDNEIQRDGYDNAGYQQTTFSEV